MPRTRANTVTPIVPWTEGASTTTLNAVHHQNPGWRECRHSGLILSLYATGHNRASALRGCTYRWPPGEVRQRQEVRFSFSSSKPTFPRWASTGCFPFLQTTVVSSQPYRWCHGSCLQDQMDRGAVSNSRGALSPEVSLVLSLDATQGLDRDSWAVVQSTGHPESNSLSTRGAAGEKGVCYLNPEEDIFFFFFK